MELFAHRGVSELAPENTMVAFELALEQKADGLEADVQLTKDGIPVLVHDEELGRTVEGEGWVADYTWNELSQLDAGAWFDPKFKGVRVPRLEELLDWAAPHSLKLNLELKNSILAYPGLEEAVLRLVAHYRLQNRVIISSFNHPSLLTCKALAPDVETGILYSHGIMEPRDYLERVPADSLHPSWPWALPDVVRQAHQYGRTVRAYTVNDRLSLIAVMAAGVDAVFTDHPARIREKMKSIGLEL
jgi:glycerophosphoryl diester phosphodiesterase